MPARWPRRPRDSPREPVRLLVSDVEGRIFDHPELLLAGVRGAGPAPIDARRLIALPRGSDLFTLPGRAPIGTRSAHAGAGRGARWEGGEARAVAAFLAPAHTACHHAAWRTRRDAPTLPLYAYTAVGFADDHYWTSAFRSDDDRRQDPWRFSRPRIEAGVARMSASCRAIASRASSSAARSSTAAAPRRTSSSAVTRDRCRSRSRATRSASAASRCSPTAQFRASHERLNDRADAARGRRRGARALRARAARRRQLRTGLRRRADALRADPRRGDAPDPRGRRARHGQPEHQRQPARRGARTLRRRPRRDPRQPELAAPEGLRRLLPAARLQLRRRRGEHRDGGARGRPRVDQPALLPRRHRHRRRARRARAA